MMQQYMKELEQDPYSFEDFVERLAWRTSDGFKEDGIHGFDPNLMHETFLQAIKDLQVLQERQHKKCEKLEDELKEEENKYSQEVSKLQDRNRESVTLFEDLDERINFIATKVIHVGDQLESVNVPRSRAVEAQKLMLYFTEFLSPGPVVSTVFTNKEELFEAADIIEKLHMISQELPSSKFKEAQQKISMKYTEIERSLIDEFVKAYRLGDISRMKEIASILTHFKSYSECMDAFIEESQMGSFIGRDIFKEIIPLTERNYRIMKEVFSNPEAVMAKFVLNIYLVKLQKHIVSSLSDKSDISKYLKNLMDLFTRTIELSAELSNYKMGTDDSYLSILTNSIFQKYLDSYIKIEEEGLKEKCSTLLTKYYESKDHQKKPLSSGGFQDLRRDLQAVIGTRANINIAEIEDYGGETFLSEELVISLIQESKQAFHRCQVLSKPLELAGNAVQLLEVLLNCVISDHVDYAVELAIQAVPIPESKTQVERGRIYFFDVVRQSNTIVHLIDKHFNDSVVPLVVSTPKHTECVMKKKFSLASLEERLDCGIDRSLNAAVGWVKGLLQSGQKKTDFKPETDLSTLSSAACNSVVQYISDTLSHIRSCLDGRNLECVLTEFGCRLHRVIYDHLQNFEYNSEGALCVICDMNEYRKCVKNFNSPLVNTLFDTLHALCNLLLVKPENLDQVCSGDHLAVLDRSVLLNFIQLRVDYKTQKLATFLRGINA